MPDYLLVVLIGFSVGLWVGSSLMARKWASNAGSYMRIEHKGKLYKVEESELWVVAQFEIIYTAMSSWDIMQ